MSQHRQQEDGLIVWLIIGLSAGGAMFFLVWMVGSHKIVYYSAKLFDVIAFPWRLLSTDHAKQVVADLDMSYVLAMRHAAYVRLVDWFSYGNLAFKPWSYLFAGAVGLLTLRQFKRIKEGMLNQALTPESLAKMTSQTFSEIAPVLAIQNDLIRDKLPGWKRQTFPIEMLEQARYQGKSVFVLDKEGNKQLDLNRLESYLKSTKKRKVGSVPLLYNKYLGNQLVNLRHDLPALAEKKDIVFMDRLSNEGKAILAIIAPYALDKKNGRKKSGAVKDALNYSAYGSKDGKANLAVDEAQASFNEWRDHPKLKSMALKHHWEYPFLCALLQTAQTRGKIGSWQFIWLKPMCRVMFYALNTVGRFTPHAQAAMAFSQRQYDERVAKEGRLPVDRELNSVIYTEKVVESLKKEWDFWVSAIPEEEFDGSVFDMDENSDGIQELLKNLRHAQKPPLPPVGADDVGIDLTKENV